MIRGFSEDKNFQRIEFTRDLLPFGDYENCTFENCIFSNMDISGMNFIDCEFDSCDFSLARLGNTSFRDVKFKGCKLLGLHFEDCNKTGLYAEFIDCQLDLSSFYRLSLKNIKLRNCSLREVDFTESNLTGLIFDSCELSGAIFKDTILEKADFRTSHNFSIDPEINKIKKAKFSAEGIMGLLDKYDIEIEQ
jgi:fluoroquinolone resistance protein